MTAAGLAAARAAQRHESQRIDVDVEYQLQYWARALGVSREALIAAVAAVGPDARAVSRHLGKG